MTTRNCTNCRQEKNFVRQEANHTVLTVRKAEGSPASGASEDRSTHTTDSGACSRIFQKFSRSNSKAANQGSGKNFSSTSSSVNLVLHEPDRLGQPIKTQFVVEGTPMVAVMDSGATISVVHTSTLLECGISEDKVRPGDFNPVDLAVSQCCTQTGLVWLQIRLLRQLFSHQLAVTSDLSCPAPFFWGPTS